MNHPVTAVFQLPIVHVLLGSERCLGTTMVYLPKNYSLETSGKRKAGWEKEGGSSTSRRNHALKMEFYGSIFQWLLMLVPLKGGR